MSTEETIIKQEQIPEYLTDSFGSLDLSKEKLGETGQKLTARYKELSEMRERSQWERGKAEAFESYHMMEKIKDLPYPGYPNLSSVLPRIGVDSFHANVMQSLFGNGFRDLVNPRYMNPQLVRQAKKGAQFLSFQLEQECEFYSVMDDADKKAQTYGIAYIEPYYVKEYRWDTVNIKETKVTPMVDPITGEVEKKVTTSTRQEKKRTTVFDGIRMESLPVESIVVSPFVRTLKQAVKVDVVFKKFRLTWESVNFKTRPDPETQKAFYLQSQVEQLKIWATDKYKNDWDELTRKRVQFDGFYLDQLLSPLSLDLVEAHYWTDIDGDGIEEKVVVTFQPDSGVVIRVSLGPCRIVELRPRPVDERFYGEGIPGICKYFDLEWEAIHNCRVAAGQWENTTFGFYQAGGRFNPSEVTIMPGHFYPVDSPHEVMFAPTNTVRSSFFQEEQLLFNYFERVFGISENLQGINSTRSLTATENIQVANKAMVRFSNPFTRIVLSIEELLGHMWDLNRACAPDEKEYYVCGIGPTPLFQKINKSDYAAQLDFKLNVSTVFDEQLNRDTWLLVFNTIRNDPSIAQHPGTVYELIDNLLKAVNVRLSVPVPPEAKILSPMEEHELFLEGEDPEPQVGEDVEEHLLYHTKTLNSDEIRSWPKEAIKKLALHIDKTKILQQTLQVANLNQSGQFTGMPPVSQGGNPITMSASRNPSSMFNRMRVSQTPGSQQNNANPQNPT